MSSGLEFNLSYAIRLFIQSKHQAKVMQVWYFRDNACAISDPENQRVIITGGGGPQVMISNNVTVYGHQGWIEDLPNMKYRRTEHGCTSYLSKGKRVSLLF